MTLQCLAAQRRCGSGHGNEDSVYYRWHKGTRSQTAMDEVHECFLNAETYEYTGESEPYEHERRRVVVDLPTQDPTVLLEPTQGDVFFFFPQEREFS